MMNTLHTHVYCDVRQSVPIEISDLHGSDVSCRYNLKRATCFVAYAETTLRRSMFLKCKTTAEEALQRGTASR